MRVCVGFLYPPPPKVRFPRETLVGWREWQVWSWFCTAASGKCLCTRNELITKPSSRQMPTKTLLSALSQSPCPSFLEGEMLNALIM